MRQLEKHAEDPCSIIVCLDDFACSRHCTEVARGIRGEATQDSTFLQNGSCITSLSVSVEHLT